MIKRLEKQIDESNNSNNSLLEKIQSLEEQIATLKNVQEGEKIFLSYEIEDFKKKHYENESSGK